jgi:hypothetical protein
MGPRSGLNLSERSVVFPAVVLTLDRDPELKYPRHKSRLLQLHKSSSLTTTYLITVVITSPLRLYLIQFQLNHPVSST